MATKWLLLATFYFDSRTTRVSKGSVTGPSYTYEARLLNAGYLDRSISVPSGLYQGSDAVIELAETDRGLREFLSVETPLRRLFELKLMPDGGSEAAYDSFGTMEVVDIEFLPGKCVVTGRDITWSWIDKQLPGHGNRTNFPWLADGVDEFFIPILQGVLESPGVASPTGLQGVVALPYMGPTTAGSPPVLVDRYALAQTPIVGATVYRRLPDEGIWSLVSSGYVITEEQHEIEGITYTFSFLDFTSPQVPGTQIRVDAEGIYYRGDWFGMPGISTPGTPIRNPVDFLINILFALLANEQRQPRYNVASFTAVRAILEANLGGSPPTGYLCDGAITEPITARELLSRILTSFELDLFTDRYGALTLAYTAETDPDRPVFSQGPIFGDPTDRSLILMNSTRFRVANPYVNRLRYDFGRNHAAAEWAEKLVYDNEEDQILLGGAFSPPIPEVVEDKLQLWFVRDEATATHVALRRMNYLALGSYRCELQAPLPECFDDIELAQMFGVTSHWGLAPGGMHNTEFKTTGLTYDLSSLICTIRGILRVPMVLAEEGVPIGAGFWAVSQGMVGSDETFVRSSFYYNTNDYNDVRRHIFGGIVSSNDTIAHTCWILDETDDIVGWLTVPPNVTGSERQWLTPVEWFPLEGGHVYRCRMGSFTSGGTGIVSPAMWAPLICNPQRTRGAVINKVRLTYDLAGNQEEGPTGTADGGIAEDGTSRLDRAFDQSQNISAVADELQDTPEVWNRWERDDAKWGNAVTDIRFETVHGWGGLDSGPTTLAYIRLGDTPEVTPANLSDTFNRANQQQLGTASGGFSWQPVEMSVSSHRMDIGHTLGPVANKAVVVCNNNWTSYRAEQDLPSVDHYAQAEVMSTLSSNQQGVIVRFDSASATYYCLSTNRTNQTLQLRKFVTGVITDIDTFSVPTLANTDTPQTIRLAVQGTTLTAYFQGSVVGTATDSSISTGTRVGVWGFSTLLGGAAGKIDNFTATDDLDDVSGGNEVIHTSTYIPTGTITLPYVIGHDITDGLAGSPPILPDGGLYGASLYRHPEASFTVSKGYKAQVHVTLELESGDEYEDPYTISRSWQPSAAGVMMSRRQCADLTDAVEAYFEAWGQRTASGGHSFFLFDAGTSKSGTSGSAIAASEIEFTSDARALVRSVNILPYLAHGNLYGVSYTPDGGSGQITGCAMLVIKRRVAAGVFSPGQPAEPGNPPPGTPGAGGGTEGVPDITGPAYYISPTGSDSNDGTSAAPWKTFAWALFQLPDNSTLVLKDGTYTVATTGMISVNNSHGTGITVRAENERQAFLSSDGSVRPITITDQSGWRFIGLHARGADLNGGEGGILMAYRCTNLTVQRNVFRNPNRYGTDDYVCLFWSDGTAAGGHRIIENEIYSYHGHGFSTKYETNNTFRRNYANSRAVADIGGGAVTDPTTKGDTGFAVYPGSNHLFENNTSEGNGTGFTVQPENLSDGNTFYGNISIGDSIGFNTAGRESKCTDTIYAHNLALDSLSIGFYFRGSEGTVVTNCRAEGGASHGFAADIPSGMGVTPSPTTTLVNCLSLNNADHGFIMIDQTSFSINYGASSGNGTAYSPAASDPSITNEFTAAPTNMGTDVTVTPGASNLSGAGLAGADIGCNIINRYENGVLTGTALWGPGFPVGATVTGVNDVAGSSAYDVHTRLGK